MRKGMLTTLSALPAEDTENHHHTTIKKKEGGLLCCPHRVPRTASQSAEKPVGRATVFPMASAETSQRKREHPLLAKSSKISRVITSGELK